MAALILVQHGEKVRRPGNPGLTAKGRAQAQQAADALAERVTPVAVYASPLQRAAESASIIADHFGLDVRYDDRLRERINWEGEPVQSFEAFLMDWERSTSDRDYVPARGDSSRRAAERMLRAVSDIADSHPAAVAVGVTHGGVTVDLLRTLLGDDALAESAPRLLPAGVPCCALTTLSRAGGTWVVHGVAQPVQHGL